MTTYAPFFIPGHPKPKGSWTPVYTKTGLKFRHASNKTAFWCKKLDEELQLRWPHLLIEEGPIIVECMFLIPRPKTVKRRYPIGKFDGDCDKLVRAILDGLTGVAYKDDSQVVDAIGKKRYADDVESGVWITLSTDV
jgi:crossover junction endodeoxyribonuclease RusA